MGGVKKECARKMMSSGRFILRGTGGTDIDNSAQLRVSTNNNWGSSGTFMANPQQISCIEAMAFQKNRRMLAE